MTGMVINHNHYQKEKMRRERTRRKQFNKQNHRYEKLVVVELDTGRRTTAITLSKGRYAIGDDVWRMANKADMCEYPYKIVDNYEFVLFYKIEEQANYTALPFVG